MISGNIGILSTMSRGTEAYLSLRSRGFEVRGLVSKAQLVEGSAGSTDLESFDILPGDEDIEEWVRRSELDLMVVAGFPRRIGKDVFSSPKFGTLNMHAGPLPEFRGGSPLAWQIIEGRPVVEISLHIMEETLDTGPVVMRGSFPLSPRENVGHAKLLSDRLFASMLVEYCSDREKFMERAVAQDNVRAGYRPQRTYSDGEIIWESMSSRQVLNLVRATSPNYGGAHCWQDGELLQIHRVEEVQLQSPQPPGTFFYRDNRGPFVVCNPGVVELIETRKACVAT